MARAKSVSTSKSRKTATRYKPAYVYHRVTSLFRRTADSLDGTDKRSAGQEVERLLAELTKDDRVIARAVALGIVKRIEAL
jgi:hypothetical protein